LRTDWEEAKDPRKQEEQDRDNVDRPTPFAQVELARKQWLATNALQRDTRDGDEVRCQHRRYT
jgi:hypothetical protein